MWSSRVGGEGRSTKKKRIARVFFETATGPERLYSSLPRSRVRKTKKKKLDKG